jgi:hypothetical protein
VRLNLPVSPGDAELLAAMRDAKRGYGSPSARRAGCWLDAAHELWAAKDQIGPRGEGWRTWLRMAGRGYG